MQQHIGPLVVQIEEGLETFKLIGFLQFIDIGIFQRYLCRGICPDRRRRRRRRREEEEGRRKKIASVIIYP